MGNLREESLLFSLKQLFEDQKERVQREQEQEERRQLAEQAEREENLQRLHAAELKRQVEAERRQRAEEQRQREEQLRLTALKNAEIERVRAEVEGKNRLEQAALTHEHELRMAALGHETRFQRQRYLVAASLLLAVAFVTAGVSLYFGKLRPEAEALAQNYESAINSQREHIGQTRRQLSSLEEERQELQRQLDDAREQGRAKPAVPPVDRPEPSWRIHRQPAKPTEPRPKAGNGMDPHDPLNPTLGR